MDENETLRNVYDKLYTLFCCCDTFTFVVMTTYSSNRLTIGKVEWAMFAVLGHLEFLFTDTFHDQSCMFVILFVTFNR